MSAGRLSFDYVRMRYGVPAGRGVRVTADGKPGRVTSGCGNYIRVRLDGETFSRIFHPTWRMTYHVEPPRASRRLHAERADRPGGGPARDTT